MKKRLNAALNAAQQALTGGGGDMSDVWRNLTRVGLEYASTPAGRQPYEARLHGTDPNDPDHDNDRHMLSAADGLRVFRRTAGKLVADLSPGATATTYSDLLDTEATVRAELHFALLQWETNGPQDWSTPDPKVAQLSLEATAAASARHRFATHTGAPPMPEDTLHPSRCPACGHWQANPDNHMCPQDPYAPDPVVPNHMGKPTTPVAV